MANLLANVDRWTDVDGNKPPAHVLDGAFYLAPSPGDGAYFEMSTTPGDGLIVVGDTVSGSAIFQWDDATTYYLQCGDFDVRSRYGATLLTKGQRVPFSFTINGTPSLGVWLSASTGSGSALIYGLGYDFRQAAPPLCEEIGRSTRNFVSAYQRDRVHYSSLYAPEVRCIVTNFNGAIPPGRSIASASWQTWDNQVVVMSDPQVSAREVQARIKAQYTGRARILVTATLDNGEVYTAWHVVRVNPAPYFNSYQSWASGPQRLDASAT